MTMYDVSETESEKYREEILIAPFKDGKKEPRKYYPYLDLNSNQFPEIENIKVGSKVMLMIEVKPTRFSINEKEEGKKPKSEMHFEILRVGMGDIEKGMDKEEKMNKMLEKMYPKKDKK